MLTLTGTLRQFGDVSYGKEGEPKTDYLKLWIEHETPRENGPADLKIEELLIPKADVGAEAKNLRQGGKLSVAVRAYPKGRDVAFQCVGLVGAASTSSSAS